MIALVFRSMIAGALLATLAFGAPGFVAPSSAADVSLTRRAVGPVSKPLPFPRSDRAQSVWAGGACWSECGSYCAWGQTACLSRDGQGQCLKLTDDCDRYCQRSCRTSGGPWLPLDF